MTQVHHPGVAPGRTRTRLQALVDTSWLAAATVYVAYAFGTHLGSNIEQLNVVVLFMLAFAAAAALPIVFPRGNYSVVIDLTDAIVLTSLFFIGSFELLLVIVFGFTISQLRPRRENHHGLISLCDLIVTFAPVGLLLHPPFGSLNNDALTSLVAIGLVISVPNTLFHVLYSLIAGNKRLPGATRRVIAMRVFNSIFNIAVAVVAVVILRHTPQAIPALFVVVGAFVMVMRGGRRGANDRERIEWLSRLISSLGRTPAEDPRATFTSGLEELFPSMTFSIVDYEMLSDNINAVFPIGNIDGRDFWLIARNRINVPNKMSTEDRRFMEAGSAVLREFYQRSRLASTVDDARLHDVLTGLPTRRLLDELINGSIANAQRNSSHFGVLTINCDDFRKVNSEYGHDQGDMFLIELSARIRYALRSNDIIARVSSDNFVVALPSIRNRSDIERVIVKVFDAMETPIGIGDGVRAWLSIGAAMFPENGQTAKELIEASDIAMRQAKRNKDGWIFASRSAARRFESDSPGLQWQHTTDAPV